MSNNNTIILLNAIKKWEKPGDKIVVGVDGYSGAGKTTLLKGIISDDYLIVSRDDFAIPRIDFETKYKNAKSEDDRIDVMVNEIINIEELVNFIEEYKSKDGIVNWTLRGDISGLKNEVKEFDFSKKVLIIEGIFLFRHDELSSLFNKKVFLDIDQDIADERRVRREKEKWGKDYFPDSHPDSYFKYIKMGFNNYLKEQNPMEQADLVIKSGI